MNLQKIKRRGDDVIMTCDRCGRIWHIPLGKYQNDDFECVCHGYEYLDNGTDYFPHEMIADASKDQSKIETAIIKKQ